MVIVKTLLIMIIHITYTYNYRPPEILTQLTYDLSADVWALGCTLIQILTAVVAFQPQNITFEDNILINKNY